MNDLLPIHPLEILFRDKNCLLSVFLETTKGFQAKFKQNVDVEKKMDWVDELSDLRENHFRAIQVLDQAIDQQKRKLNSHDLEILQGFDSFKVTLGETLELIQEIQLTDQSLFFIHSEYGIRASGSDPKRP